MYINKVLIFMFLSILALMPDTVRHQDPQEIHFSLPHLLQDANAATAKTVNNLFSDRLMMTTVIAASSILAVLSAVVGFLPRLMSQNRHLKSSGERPHMLSSHHHHPLHWLLLTTPTTLF